MRVTKSAANRGQNNMIFGALWCVGGIVVTAVTYSSAVSSPGGGHYIIAWGAIVFGAVQFFKWLLQSAEG